MRAVVRLVDAGPGPLRACSRRRVAGAHSGRYGTAVLPGSGQKHRRDGRRSTQTALRVLAADEDSDALQRIAGAARSARPRRHRRRSHRSPRRATRSRADDPDASRRRRPRRPRARARPDRRAQRGARHGPVIALLTGQDAAFARPPPTRGHRGDRLGATLEDLGTALEVAMRRRADHARCPSASVSSSTRSSAAR